MISLGENLILSVHVQALEFLMNGQHMMIFQRKLLPINQILDNSKLTHERRHLIPLHIINHTQILLQQFFINVRYTTLRCTFQIENGNADF